MTYRVPDATFALLQNWSRWCWLGPWPHPLPPIYCGSAERLYKIPEGNEDQDGPMLRHSAVDVDGALRVQAVWRGLPDAPRFALKAEFPARDGRDRPALARSLKMSLNQYETHLAYAVAQVQREFTVEVRP
ncbi:MAG: hypothetical protein LBH10_06765 [Burkholderiaceae bacterium]|jgi:hypothetical protein|nr:hypothetical protein [Burkholderiaceae bacterium]